MRNKVVIPDNYNPQKENIKKKGEHRGKSKIDQSSFSRLNTNAHTIERLLATRPELKQLRFDEFELLHDIRQIVESDPMKFELIEDPVKLRRELRFQVLPKYLTTTFIRQIQEKLLSELLHTVLTPADQDALMTALVFLQSHTDLGISCEDNPLWEIIFNLSIKDGIRFVDSLTALIEGLDSIKQNNPEILSQEPLLLQKTSQICQWEIFWRHLAEFNKNVQPFESLISDLIRGEMIVEIYFDEIIHLPLFLYRQFKEVLSFNSFFSDQLTDHEKEDISKSIFENMLRSTECDLPSILPPLIKRLRKAKKKLVNSEKAEQIDLLLDSLSKKTVPSNHIFLLTLLTMKVTMKRYWDNKRDFFFFFTVLKNPEDPRNYYDLAQIMYKIKEVDAIEKILNCAIEVDGQSFWGYWGLGSYYLKMNKLEASEEKLLTALKLAQQLEIRSPGELRRELFLIREDINSLRSRKLKQQATIQPQIALF